MGAARGLSPQPTWPRSTRLPEWRTAHRLQLGTEHGDPEGDAVRDHREVTLLLRAEINALTALHAQHTACSRGGVSAALAEEDEGALTAGLGAALPGVTATTTPAHRPQKATFMHGMAA
jgi:hypothetical protein